MTRSTAALPTASSTALIKQLLLGAQAATAALAALASRHDLTVDDWLILDALHTADGASMSEISRETIASGASLTRAVDRLVTRSLVYRTPSATDRRKVEVQISDLGRELHGRIHPEVAALDVDLRSAFTEVDVDEATAALGRLTTQTPPAK